MAIFGFFKMAAVRHLVFKKLVFLRPAELKQPICVIMPNYVAIGQTVAKL